MVKRISSLLLAVLSAITLSAQVKTGVEVLRESGFAALKGKRVGLVTNPTGVDRNLKSTVDILFEAHEVELKALFGPEHGVRGDAPAGAVIEGAAVDSKTGVPIYSLYGSLKAPTKEMLKGLDAIVYDIQDIGCRSYTYISTMGNVMKVAAEAGLEMVILDRPNPLGGEKIEGCGVQPELVSFVSKFDIPYVYGLTCGELARLLNGEGMIGNDASGRPLKCRLTVVEMEGWTRDMSYSQTGLPWVPSSPHIPSVEAAYLYPATGIAGELGICSIGVGYTLPFQMMGGKDIDAVKLAEYLNKQDFPGITFRPIYATPYYGGLKGIIIGGVQIYITDFRAARLSEIQFRVIEAMHKLYPSMPMIGSVAEKSLQMFDKVTGNSQIRKKFAEHYRFSDISGLWYSECEQFRELSQKYYLYEESYF